MSKKLDKIRCCKKEPGSDEFGNILALCVIMAAFAGILLVASMATGVIEIMEINMAFAERQHTMLYKWGSYGIGEEGKFVHPQFMAVDKSNGNIYVTDLGNKRVQKFDSQGVFLTSWGNSGHANGEFNYPSGIATDGTFVYVADRDLNRVQKFDLDGNYISQWGERGKMEGSLSMPNDIVTSNDGYVYVVDTGNYRVQKFTTEGEFVLSFGGSGIQQGKFITPHGIDIDDNDNSIHVSDRGNKRISQYMTNGTYIKSYEFEGTSSFEFMPESIKIANDSMIYVTNAHSQNIMYLNSSEDARLLTAFEQYGPFHSERMIFPTDMAFGIDGQLYVIDTLDHTIYAYTTPQYERTTTTLQQQQQQFVDNDTNNSTEKQHPIYYDTTPPTITAPSDITVDATGVLTLIDIGVAQVADDHQIKATLTNAPEKFPIGTTKVTWIAFDEANNTNEDYQFVTVLACGLQQSKYNTIQGTSANDIIDGTSQADLIFGHAGKDIIRGGSGNDCIFGEEGDDFIEGGPGSDYIVGGSGNDILKGDAGNDTIYGGTGGDILDGGESSADRCMQIDGLDLMINCEIAAEY